MNVKVTVENQSFDVEIQDIHARPVIAVVDGVQFEIWPENCGSNNHTSAPVRPSTVGTSTPLGNARPAITTEAAAIQATNSSPKDPGSAAGRTVQAPLPGVIVSINVKPGDLVNPGQELCVLEAMKMKNAIRSTRSGKVSAVLTQIGQHVRHHDPLVEFED